jgi:hypothetical protein
MSRVVSSDPPVSSIDPTRYDRSVTADRPIQLWPRGPSDTITRVTLVKGAVWVSRAELDAGKTYPIRAEIEFDPGVFTQGIVVQDGDAWVLVAAQLDGWPLDVRRILPRLIREQVGKVARQILQDRYRR